MKKVLLTTIIAAAAFFMAANANAQIFSAGISFGVRMPARQSFYYYPSANAYFNIATRQYIYQRQGAWITANAMPYGMMVANAPRFMVYHNGYDVWAENRAHIVAYGGYAPRPAVVYQPYAYRFGYRGYYNGCR